MRDTPASSAIRVSVADCQPPEEIAQLAAVGVRIFSPEDGARLGECTGKFTHEARTAADYPAMLREISELFLAGGVSTESRSKTQQYKSLAEASALIITLNHPEAIDAVVANVRAIDRKSVV